MICSNGAEKYDMGGRVSQRVNIGVCRVLGLRCLPTLTR